VSKLKNARGLGALVVSIIAVVAALVGNAGAAGSSAPVTKTFSFINTTNNKTTTLFSADGLIVNARCDPQNAPVIFAFTSAFNANLLGHVIDGSGPASDRKRRVQQVRQGRQPCAEHRRRPRRQRHARVRDRCRQSRQRHLRV